MFVYAKNVSLVSRFLWKVCVSSIVTNPSNVLFANALIDKRFRLVVRTPLSKYGSPGNPVSSCFTLQLPGLLVRPVSRRRNVQKSFPLPYTQTHGMPYILCIRPTFRCFDACHSPSVHLWTTSKPFIFILHRRFARPWSIAASPLCLQVLWGDGWVGHLLLGSDSHCFWLSILPPSPKRL
jgi:hypothetical protein